MEYQLVIQFSKKLKGGFDRLIELENNLEEKFATSQIAQVDGHDSGQGEMNIFILTNNPLDTFKKIKDLLTRETDIILNMKVAYRDTKTDGFICLWPKNLTKFQVK